MREYYGHFFWHCIGYICITTWLDSHLMVVLHDGKMTLSDGFKIKHVLMPLAKRELPPFAHGLAKDWLHSINLLQINRHTHILDSRTCCHTSLKYPEMMDFMSSASSLIR